MLTSARKIQLAQNIIQKQNQGIQPIKSVPRISANIKTLAPVVTMIDGNPIIRYTGVKGAEVAPSITKVQAKPMAINLDEIATRSGEATQTQSQTQTPIEYDEYGNIKDKIIYNDDELKKVLSEEKSEMRASDKTQDVFWYLVIGAGLIGAVYYGYSRYADKK